MSELRIKLMAREAAALMADAEILHRNIFSESHGAYLLDLLALEREQTRLAPDFEV